MCGWNWLAAAVAIVVLKHVFSDAFLDGGSPTEAEYEAERARYRKQAES
jgi:hypothetical protein